MNDKRIPHLHAHPTNPDYTGEPASDPRVHGPEICPHRCSVCEDGRHHWIEDSLFEDVYGESDPRFPGTEEDATDSEATKAVKKFDRENGTEHRYAFYGCKHCSAWAEAEYVWEMEDAEDASEGE